jgi:multiple sugar transport system substrate-binding protein/raffinose/stachyose/melibiose transport system substrate-binding protein
MAMCGPYFDYLGNRLLPSQSQKLMLRVSPMRDLALEAHEAALLWLEGTLSPTQAEFQSTFQLLRDTTQLMPIGFAQMQRDDALFMFLQGNAVCFIAGSWDFGVLVRDGPFPVNVDRIPMPGPDDPRYGHFTLGQVSEAALNHEAALGIVRHAEHPELALDYLRFLTSPEIARMFSDYSNRVSNVLDVPPPAGAKALAPELGGAVAGIASDLPLMSGRFTKTLFDRNLYRVTGTSGSVAEFTAALVAGMPGAVAADLQRFLRDERLEIERADGLLGLQWTQPDGPNPHWRVTVEGQHQRESQYHDYAARIEAANR